VIDHNEPFHTLSLISHDRGPTRDAGVTMYTGEEGLASAMRAWGRP
jgi:hypothetical protein